MSAVECIFLYFLPFVLFLSFCVLLWRLGGEGDKGALLWPAMPVRDRIRTNVRSNTAADMALRATCSRTKTKDNT